MEEEAYEYLCIIDSENESETDSHLDEVTFGSINFYNKEKLEAYNFV